MREVDARGFACPQPVLMTKKVIEEGEREFTVWVDNAGSAGNVARFGREQGYEVTVEEKEEGFKVTLKKTDKEGTSERREVVCDSMVFPKEKVLFISSDSLGRGSEELGRTLMKAFVNALSENEVIPKKIVMVNSGVKLACTGSELLEALRKLEERGVEILVCGTCLNYFNLMEEIKVGKVSNAYEILNTLLQNEVVGWS
uniref:Sulfurtransferase-like selenium metabolism protein YedF n=1 Tax=Thermodesulfobacterium geofontis TaxID=1295609 RepID=A0A7V6CE32_9BACT